MLSAKSWTLYSFSSTVFVLDFIAIWTDVHSDWDVRQNGRGYFTRYECGWILLLSQTQFCKKYYFKIGSFRLRFLSPSLRESKTVLVSKILDSTPSLPDSRYYPASKLSGALWRRGGKRKESLQIRLSKLNSTSNAPVAPRQLSCPISANQREAETSANVKKKTGVMMSLLTSSPPTSISHRHFRCRSIFKFQRRSSKLSFLFPPRRQSAPESLFAGYPGTGFLSLSIDCCWMRIFFYDAIQIWRTKWYIHTKSQSSTNNWAGHASRWEKSSPRFLDNQN